MSPAPSKRTRGGLEVGCGAAHQGRGGLHHDGAAAAGRGAVRRGGGVNAGAGGGRRARRRCSQLRLRPCPDARRAAEAPRARPRGRCDRGRGPRARGAWPIGAGRPGRPLPRGDDLTPIPRPPAAAGPPPAPRCAADCTHRPAERATGAARTTGAARAPRTTALRPAFMERAISAGVGCGVAFWARPKVDRAPQAGVSLGGLAARPPPHPTHCPPLPAASQRPRKAPRAGARPGACEPGGLPVYLPRPTSTNGGPAGRPWAAPPQGAAARHARAAVAPPALPPRPLAPPSPLGDGFPQTNQEARVLHLGRVLALFWALGGGT
jgi:hypothetical protein